MTAMDDLIARLGRLHKMLIEMKFDANAKVVEHAIAALAASPAPALPESGVEGFKGAVAALAAAISLLERTPAAKKAAPSDKMFAMMLDNYRKALETARTALASPAPALPESGVEARAIAWLRERGDNISYKCTIHDIDEAIAAVAALATPTPTPEAAGLAREPVAWVNESYRDDMLLRTGKGYWHAPMMCGKPFQGAFPVYLDPPSALATPAPAPAPAPDPVDAAGLVARLEDLGLSALADAAGSALAAAAEREAALVDKLARVEADRDFFKVRREAAEARVTAAEAERERLVAALEPFADCVFNDNGDITVTLRPFTPDELIAAYFARRARAAIRKETT